MWLGSLVLGFGSKFRTHCFEFRVSVWRSGFVLQGAGSRVQLARGSLVHVLQRRGMPNARTHNGKI